MDHKVCIVGATGYTGSILNEILKGHPDVDIVAATSRSEENYFKLNIDEELGVEEGVDELLALEPEVIFLAIDDDTTPYVDEFKEHARFIDLTTTFRTNYLEVSKNGVYGLPELPKQREKISKADFVTNPGCYPTSIILGLLPLVEESKDVIEAINIVSVSSKTGAGKKSKNEWYTENIGSYGTVSEDGKKFHKHLPEIEHVLSLLGKDITIEFQPVVDDTPPGMLSTIYAKISYKLSDAELSELYSAYYQNEPFVKILSDREPDTKSIRGTNRCDILARYNPKTSNVIIRAAIDNLIKGASGQAVQNMNLMLNLDEKEGLTC